LRSICTAPAEEHPAGAEYSVCLSCCRYTYGQPVRGTAAISVSIQPYSKYDRSQYGSKLYNVQVSMTATSAAYLQLSVTGGIADTRQDAGGAFREVHCLAGRHVVALIETFRCPILSAVERPPVTYLCNCSASLHIVEARYLKVLWLCKRMRNNPRRRHELDYVTAFSARRYASAVYAMVPSCLCLSISLSVQLKLEFYQNG